MSPTPRLARLAALPAVIVLAFAGGCNSKSDSVNSVTAGTGGATQDDIAVSAAGTLGFVTEFVSQVQPLAEGDFSGVGLDFDAVGADALGGPRWPISAPAGLFNSGPNRSEPEVVWDEPEQSWVLDTHETDTSADGTATLDLHFAVQYLTAAGTPQQLPDGNTAAMTVDVSMAVDLEGSSDGEVFELSVAYDMSMAVGGLTSGPYSVDGGGSMDMSLLWTGPSTDGLAFAIGMDWLMDVDVPLNGGCPSGLVTMNADAGESNQFSFVGTYDGSPTYDWTLYEAGVAVESGSEVMPCSAPTL